MASKTKRKAVWFDAEIAAMLEVITEKLYVKLGFRPTTSQVIRYLLKEGLPDDGIVPKDSLDHF
jgi:hypothetical protein